MSAKKFDSDKPRMELLPGKALEEISRVLAAGGVKYGDHNWRQGMNHSRLIGAAYRHLTAFNSGENLDPETGLSHLAHLGCCVMFLLEYQALGLGNDDRYNSKSQETMKYPSIDEQERKIADFEGYVHLADVQKMLNGCEAIQPLKLEVGKRYYRKDGCVTGRLRLGYVYKNKHIDPKSSIVYCENGTNGLNPEYDLIEEYNEEKNSVSKS